MAKIWRYTFVATHGVTGEQMLTGLHYQTDVPVAGSEPSAAEVLEQIDQHFSSSGRNCLTYRNLLDNSSKLVETRVYEEVADPRTEPHEAASYSHDLDGTAGSPPSDQLPPALCAYIALKTNKVGRSFRGGTHTPALCFPSVLDGNGALQSGTGWMTNATAFGDALIDALEDVFQNTGDINPVIYSRTRHRRGEDATEPITSYLIRTQVRWLRRRMTSP